eukprot:scaffold29499_cov60-Phaeocystis_antarctica.AAC.6
MFNLSATTQLCAYTHGGISRAPLPVSVYLISLTIAPRRAGAGRDRRAAAARAAARLALGQLDDLRPVHEQDDRKVLHY